MGRRISSASSARYLKHKVIEAVVWDYNIQATFDLDISTADVCAALEAVLKVEIVR